MQNARKGFVANFRASARDARAQREREAQQRDAYERAVEREIRRRERDNAAAERASARSEMERRNAAVASQVSALADILGNRSPLETAISSYSVAPPGDAPTQLPLPRKPLVARVSATARRRYEEQQAAVIERNQQALDEHQVRVAEHALADEHLQRLHVARGEVLNGSSDALVAFLEAALSLLQLPEGFPRTARVAYGEASKQLVVEYELPGQDVVPAIKQYRYASASRSLTAVNRSSAERNQLYAQVLAQLTLRVLDGLFGYAPIERFIDVVAFNGHVSTTDSATGARIRPCVLSLRVSRERFGQIDLEYVDPVACLRALNTAMSLGSSELSPVRPVLTFSMLDPRFVDADDVLTSLDSRPNLLELSPSEFEFLITNLFEKMGLETRQTQASRDGGVDCVAYNTEPVLGGKVVIQAKRYKDTVGVSAVRDLYGTVQNEGASKGILVTTSGYGKAAFDFAQNKPLELLEGGHLLYLLAQYAGIEARIEVP